MQSNPNFESQAVSEMLLAAAVAATVSLYTMALSSASVAALIFCLTNRHRQREYQRNRTQQQQSLNQNQHRQTSFHHQNYPVLTDSEHQRLAVITAKHCLAAIASLIRRSELAQLAPNPHRIDPYFLPEPLEQHWDNSSLTFFPPMDTSRVKYNERADDSQAFQALNSRARRSSLQSSVSLPMPSRSVRKFPAFKSWNRLSFVSQSRPRSRTLSSVLGGGSPNSSSSSQRNPLDEDRTRDSQDLDESAFTTKLLYQWKIPGYGHIKLTDYAPLAFKAVRERFDVGLLELEDAIGEGACHVTKTAGKSNSIFFATLDNRFLFKTLRGSEGENLVHFLPKYLNYIQSHKDTLLPQYLGLFTFEPPPQMPAAPLHFPTAHAEIPSLTSEEISSTLLIESTLSKPFTLVLMANIMDPRLPIHLRFDFKGSNVGRATLSAQDAARAPVEVLRGVVLKELDWERLREREGQARFEGVRLSPRERVRVMEMLGRDVEVLKGCGFMDYSLLVGVHRCGRSFEGCGVHMSGTKSLDWGVNESECGEVYFLGLIDVLQKFNLAKWIERELHRHRSHTSLLLGGGSGDSPRIQPDALVRRAISEQSLTLVPRESGGVMNTMQSIPVLVPNPEDPSLTMRKNSMTSVSSGTETSAEEPGRYAERLMTFADTLFV